MLRVYTMISRYILMILCMLFAYSCITSTGTNVKSAKTHRVLQHLYMYSINLILMSIIYFETNDYKIIVLYLFEIIYFISFEAIFRIAYKIIQHELLNMMLFMLMISLPMLTRISYDQGVKQFIICIVSTIVTIIIPALMKKSKNIRNYSYLFGVFGIGILSFVFVIGKETLGAKLSIDLHFITIQPSEFVKISFIVFLSGILYRYRNFKGVLISGVFAAIHVLILVLSKDLGTALILCITYLFLIYMATGRKLYLISGLFVGSLSSVVAYKFFAHVRVRVEAFVDPWPIIEGKGYQITQSLFAIGTGGLFGTGFFQGLPNNIPVVEQDFVISAFAEEMGTFFAVGILLVSFAIFVVFVRIALNCVDSFYKLTSAALAVSYGFQIFLTVGGAIKLIPSTGVTYPLLSYGGSSLLATLAVFAIIQGVYINETKLDKQ